MNLLILACLVGLYLATIFYTRPFLTQIVRQQFEITMNTLESQLDRQYAEEKPESASQIQEDLEGLLGTTDFQYDIRGYLVDTELQCLGMAANPGSGDDELSFDGLVDDVLLQKVSAWKADGDIHQEPVGLWTGYRHDNMVASYRGIESGDDLFILIVVGAYDQQQMLKNYMKGMNIDLGIALMYLIGGAAIIIAANQLYTKNQKLEAEQRTFTNAIAHELKTPLAIIMNETEMLMEGIEPDSTQHYLNSIHEEAGHLNEIVMNFLQYARLGTTTHVEMKAANLESLLLEEVEKYETLFESRRLHTSVEVKPDMKEYCMDCKADLLAFAIDNLLSNAARYTSEEGMVRILLEHSPRAKKGFRLSISNTIDVDTQLDTENIWKTLSKADLSRTRRDNSSGMGLPVAAEICRIHGISYSCVCRGDIVTFIFEK